MCLIVEALIKGIVYFFGYLVASLFGAPLVSHILSTLKIRNELEKTGIEGAGRIIGIMERMLTVTFIYLNAPTAVPLVFTAKSIVRFESAKERSFAEYYLVGTLTSITFAVIIGALFAFAADIFFNRWI
jgi:hypothetical protein